MSLASGTYAADARVIMLADAVSQDPKIVAELWNKELRSGARQLDDFSHFEGPEGSGKPFVTKSDLKGVGAGQIVNFSVMSQPKGPGARGEVQLTGRTSHVTFKTFPCKVDFWRDAVELNDKARQFMPTGSSLKAEVMRLLKAKLGRKRMNDMKMALKLQGSGNTIYPNQRKTLASLTGLDTMSPTLITNAKPQWQRLGGRPFEISKDKNKSPVYSCLAYIPDSAMTSIRNNASYQNAQINAGVRGDENTTFSGRLTPWNGVGLFEHISVDAEGDVLADPLAPRAVIDTAFGADTALGAGAHDAGVLQLISNADDTLTEFFEFFGGHDYVWWEGQTSDSNWTSFYSAITSATYYAWIVNTDGSVGFVSYVGTGNTGNRITLTSILSPAGAGTSTIGDATVGNMIATDDTWSDTPGAGGVGASANTSADYLYTDTFSAGAYVIPCNANGAVDMSSLFLGAESAVRCYASPDEMISQERDYGFVHGGGYKTIFGQAPCVRTDGKTNGYALLRHAGQHPGLEVPSLEE